MDTGATNSTPLVSLTERDPGRGHCYMTAATIANQALRQRLFPWRKASIAQGPGAGNLVYSSASVTFSV